MAEVFAHPLTLIYKVGKNLIVNGIDIFKKIAQALIAYGAQDYFTFGQHIGEAMDIIFLHAPYPKTEMDTKGYELLNGFYTGLSTNTEINREALYNNIDDLGLMIAGPFEDGINEFTKQGNMNQ